MCTILVSVFLYWYMLQILPFSTTTFAILIRIVQGGEPQLEEKALQEWLLDIKQVTSKHVYKYKAITKERTKVYKN